MSTEVRPAFGQMRIPDILETIADLSNDEVFTPPDLANKALDMLPESIWNDSSVTFLDPASKTGVFLREITKRLIAGLEHEFPDLQERVNHILTKQVYGLGITELTSLMSRRTVYCSTAANGIKSVCTEFEDSEGNIKFPESKHTFNKHGKCEVCGAGEDLYYEEEGLDNYAYSFLHDNMKEVFGDVKFDVIIGNPPYQMSTGGGTAQAVPLYHKFIQKAMEMNPRYISMIVPSRWMKGGMGLDDFRKEMMMNKNIKKIVDYEKTSDVFSTQGFDGGVNYFLIDSEHNSEFVDYEFNSRDGVKIIDKKKLLNGIVDIVIRDKRQEAIIKKTMSDNQFDTLVSPIGAFGLKSDYLDENYSRLSKVKTDEKQVKVFGLMNGKRAFLYEEYKKIPKCKDSIKKHKLFFSKAFNLRMTVPPKVIIGDEMSVSTATFLKIGDFNSSEEAENCLSYIKTRFFRALFYFRRHSLNISQSSFSLIPLQDFSKSWTDEELYAKYKLTEDEIAYIEANIEEME